MSFRCIGTTSGAVVVLPHAAPHKMSPIISVLERTKVYEYLDPLTEEMKSSAGHEIVQEFKQCHSCAGVPTPRREDTAHILTNAIAFAAWAEVHSRKCDGTKKTKNREGVVISVEPCKTCAGINDGFARLSPAVLNKVLEEPKVPEMGFSFFDLAADGVQRQAERKSKRAENDIKAAYEILAPFYRKTKKAKEA